MKKLMLAAGVLAAMGTGGGDVLACGDKLVVVGRGRPNRMKGVRSAAILMYADPRGSLPAALEEGHLRQDLERAGHRIRSVTTREELGAALQTGSYDLVFADFKSAPSIEADAREARSKPTVLPTLYKPTAAESAAAEQQYHCVMKAPSTQKDYLAVVNEALAERAKQSAATKKN